MVARPKPFSVRCATLSIRTLLAHLPATPLRAFYGIGDCLTFFFLAADHPDQHQGHCQFFHCFVFLLFAANTTLCPARWLFAGCPPAAPKAHPFHITLIYSTCS